VIQGQKAPNGHTFVSAASALIPSALPCLSASGRTFSFAAFFGRGPSPQLAGAFLSGLEEVFRGFLPFGSLAIRALRAAGGTRPGMVASFRISNAFLIRDEPKVRTNRVSCASPYGITACSWNREMFALERIN
jgi:hypothetical protein